MEFVKSFWRCRKSENGLMRKIRVSEGFGSVKGAAKFGCVRLDSWVKRGTRTEERGETWP